ncbi:acyl-CoA thioester hydrolase [Dethiosulfatibacter aminovorans DSM 17477]|uniref:Acyl-CoA thioester hydrolase n=1 Tax=Dethiosulfatibacter aminovorans DSM 17477 TaxID=1121476 RepID=A0A1M6GL93_9FIRM|nr:acyl-CoA thioesterase [Dethiosulfatibacter aminovorans]SHJ10709.1 acyl-CoA thioester hydrolase [Dethiosulfatibacter aminovorans DSM 17477]
MTYKYIRKAHYHETDQMGIIHHANYIKWFEEARIEIMDKIGVPYKAIEERGIISPVLHVGCDYKNMVRFDEEVTIQVGFKSYSGVKFSVEYLVTDQSGETVYVTGESDHCFLNKSLKPVSLKKVAPDMHERFKESLMFK